MRELVGVITKSKFVPADTDLLQVAKAVRSQAMNFAEDTGSENKLSCAFDPPLASYTIGLTIRVRVRNANTGGATINAGAGEVLIKRPNGTAVATGDLPAGSIANLIYDGAAFQLTNVSGGGNVTVQAQNIPYADDNGVLNAISAPFSPAITALAKGMLLEVGGIKFTNTSATTLKVNALAPIPVKTRGPTGNVSDLLPGDIAANDVVIFAYDGTNFQITPNALMPVSATILVPSQYPDVLTVMNAIARKRIAQTATLTIQLASGIYQPFAFFHPDASRIWIKGTMIAPRPQSTDIVRTGYSQTARANDTNTNLAMLRTRYGTEIRIDRNHDMGLFIAGHAVGVANMGGGLPVIADVLITGGRQAGENGYGQASALDEVGVMAGLSGAIYATNVAVSLCGTGFKGLSNAALYAPNTIAIGNSFCGYLAMTNGTVDASPGWAFSNGYCGWYGLTNSLVAAQGYGSCNNICGILVQTSQAGTTNAEFVTNGTTDVMATIGGEIGMEAPTIYGTLSPAANTVGNNNALILKNF